MADTHNYIRVKHNEEKICFKITNGLLSFSALKQYFPLASGLLYILGEDVVALPFVNENYLQINPHINVYKAYIAELDAENNIKETGDRLEDKIIKYFRANYQYADICKLLSEKHNIKLSLRTLKRLLKEKCLKRKNVSENCIEEILAAMYIELENSGYNLGYRALWQRLQKEYKITIKQETVLKILQIIDPEGVEGRKRNRLRRRNYSVPGPNFLWHVDGYDKLKRFGFAIHGCIDGFSKKLLWLEVASTNNDPEIIAYFYLRTVTKYNCLPTVIRSDKGTENCVMESMQQCMRYHHNDEHAGKNSFITGKSTANQRIEASWGQLRRHVAGFYIDLFKKMEEENILNTGNCLHTESLRCCFGPLIINDLYNYRKEWNEHHIRKQNNRNLCGGKPNIKYYLPEQFGARECKKPLNKEHVQILMDNYAKEPSLISVQFSNLLTEMNLPRPCTAQEAYELYLEILRYIDISEFN